MPSSKYSDNNDPVNRFRHSSDLLLSKFEEILEQNKQERLSSVFLFVVGYFVVLFVGLLGVYVYLT